MGEYKIVRPVQPGDTEGEPAAWPRTEKKNCKRETAAQKAARKLDATRKLAAGEITAAEAWRLYKGE